MTRYRWERCIAKAAEAERSFHSSMTVDLLQSQGAGPQRDCRELFRRVVFNILIHNTDDHLRNHGFFVGTQGLTLSPAFDMNPSIERTMLTLAINEVESDCDVGIALDACADYGLARRDADSVITEVRTAIANWRGVESELRIPKAEQDLMARAFEG